MASSLYRNYKKLAMSGVVNLVTDNIKLMLISGNYNVNLASNLQSHTVTGDLGASVEVVGAGYTPGGVLLTTKVIRGSSTEAQFDADDISLSSTTLTASGAILYRSGSTPATNYLIAALDFGGNQTSSNGTFSITWNSEGIINLD